MTLTMQTKSFLSYQLGEGGVDELMRKFFKNYTHWCKFLGRKSNIRCVNWSNSLVAFNHFYFVCSLHKKPGSLSLSLSLCACGGGRGGIYLFCNMLFHQLLNVLPSFKIFIFLIVYVFLVNHNSVGLNFVSVFSHSVLLTKSVTWLQLTFCETGCPTI